MDVPQDEIAMQIKPLIWLILLKNKKEFVLHVSEN